jgi:prepilin-type N-terminal cleavage/methylation domain-containing protein
MRAFRGKRGFALVELLIVLVILAFLLLLVSLAVIRYIDKARGTAASVDARSVYIAAQGVLAMHYSTGNTLDDQDYAEGLSGMVDDILHPEQTAISKKMNEMLAPGITLGAEPDDGVSKATFTVESGQITSLVYQAKTGGRTYQATITLGAEEAVIERID